MSTPGGTRTPNLLIRSHTELTYLAEEGELDSRLGEVCVVRIAGLDDCDDNSVSLGKLFPRHEEHRDRESGGRDRVYVGHNGEVGDMKSDYGFLYSALDPR